MKLYFRDYEDMADACANPQASARRSAMRGRSARLSPEAAKRS